MRNGKCSVCTIHPFLQKGLKPVSLMPRVLRYIAYSLKRMLKYTFVDYFIHNKFLNIFCIRLIMGKYDSKSYLRRNIINNPIFHYSVELKFANHGNIRSIANFNSKSYIEQNLQILLMEKLNYVSVSTDRQTDEFCVSVSTDGQTDGQINLGGGG